MGDSHITLEIYQQKILWSLKIVFIRIKHLPH